MERNRGGFIGGGRSKVGIGWEGSLFNGAEEFAIGGKDEGAISRLEVMPKVMAERRRSNGNILEPW